MNFSTVQDVKNYVNDKVQEHLYDKDVTVKYSNRMTKGLGLCEEQHSYINGTKYIITFNNNFLANNLDKSDVIKEVVLHELAHVIASGYNHHNIVWQQECRRIGGNPVRLINGNLIHTKRYIYKCPICGKEYKTSTKFRKSRSCNCIGKGYHAETKVYLAREEWT